MTKVVVHLASKELQDEDHTRLVHLTQRTLKLISDLVIERFPDLLLKKGIIAEKGLLLPEIPTEDVLASGSIPKHYIIYFIDCKGTSHQKGKYCFVFLRNKSNNWVRNDVLQSVIAHELCHAFGCFHAYTGIMGGVDQDNPHKSPDMSLDEDSLMILSCGPVFVPCSTTKIDFKYKISDGCVHIKCTEPICLVIFSRETIYDGDVQKLEEPTTDLELDPRFSDAITCLSISGSIFTFDL